MGQALWPRAFATPVDSLPAGISLADENPGSGGVDEGYITGGVVFEFTTPIFLRPDTDNEALRFQFKVAADAPTTTAELEFIDGGIHGFGRAEKNEVIGFGSVEDPEFVHGRGRSGGGSARLSQKQQGARSP